ncbi:hypothetical protein K8Z49_27680 [Actinomadura madurae]|uniref:hypothetical protein n=1 Tax=Actinomadura madurae TaxID=1993 RepID=UPI003999C1F1
MTALKRCDIDIVNRMVQVRGADIERANGQMILGPTKSQAGMRRAAIPDANVPHLVTHLTKYTKKDDDALMFTGIKGGPLRRNGFDKVTRWKPVVEALGVPNLHFHDLDTRAPPSPPTWAPRCATSWRGWAMTMSRRRCGISTGPTKLTAPSRTGSTHSSRPTRSGTATMTTRQRDRRCRWRNCTPNALR